MKLHLNERAALHFRNMLKTDFLGQPLPRCLDQSYHEDLDNEKLDFLNNDQVIVRYIQYMKAKSSWFLEDMEDESLTRVEPTTDHQRLVGVPHSEEEEANPQPAVPTQDLGSDRRLSSGGSSVERPENDRSRSVDKKMSHIPGVGGVQEVTQRSFETTRPPQSPQRTFTGASVSSQSRGQFKRADTTTSTASGADDEESMKLFALLQKEAMSQKPSNSAQPGYGFSPIEVGANSVPLTPVDQTKYKAEPSTPHPVGNAPRPSNPGFRAVPELLTLDEPDDFLTVPHFWLFKLDAGTFYLSTSCSLPRSLLMTNTIDTIVTLYPERWDKGNEQQLHRHILDSVSEDRNVHESFHALRGGQNLDMDLVCNAILKACMSFEAKALVPFVNPDASPPGLVRKVPMPYTKAFSASIARLVSIAWLVELCA